MAALPAETVARCLSLIAKGDTQGARQLVLPAIRNGLETADNFPPEVEEILALCLATELIRDCGSAPEAACP
jgi:hypothetical protein